MARMAPSDETVLVTGGSGFIGSHTILLALQQGYKVRTTVRSLKREDEVRKALRTGGATEEQLSNLQFFAADLTKDDGWAEAVSRCTYVLHLASPFSLDAPKHEDELIRPARDGTLRALRFARETGTVKRVVVTSSFAAIGYGHEPRKEPFTEKDWSKLDGRVKVPAYQKSKTIAERAAWNFIEQTGSGMTLAVVNPVVVFGPILSSNVASSVEIVYRLLAGQVPAVPNISLGVVDVRDVADLHLRAMTDPKAAGQRFLACADGEFVWMKDIALALKKNLGTKESQKVTTRTVPNIVVKIAGLFDPNIAMVGSELGHAREASNAKAKTELGWAPRSSEEAVMASARSLFDLGVVKV